MRKTRYSIYLLILLNFLTYEYSFSQCVVVDSVNSIYRFNDPNGPGPYDGFLCSGVDSLGTSGISGYFDGDGYRVKLVAGSQVVFSVDDCNGNAVSLTLNDSAENVIAGAYSAAACPNSLDFTATYSGTYILVINLNGVCGGGGSNLLGQAYVKIKPGTTVPPCPSSGIPNDTICGAIPLDLDSGFIYGNSILAFPTDPMDQYIDSIGGATCSFPNNTLWYSYTPAVDVDTLYVVMAISPGSGYHFALNVFPAVSLSDPCHGGIHNLGCGQGPNDLIGIDTVKINHFGLLAGHTYYYMIDGYNNSTGEFSIRLESSALFNSINDRSDVINFEIFPNPAYERIQIKTNYNGKASLRVLNSIGEILDEEFSIINEKEVDVSHLKPGLYFVEIRSESRVLRKKVIVAGR